MPEAKRNRRRPSRPVSEEDSFAHSMRRSSRMDEKGVLDAEFDEDPMDDFWATEGQHYGSV